MPQQIRPHRSLSSPPATPRIDASKMTDMDASTPQLKAAKALLDGYSSRDLDAVESHLSKDFRYQTFPKVDRYPDQTKEEHVQFWRSKFSAFTKTKVRTQHQ